VKINLSKKGGNQGPFCSNKGSANQTPKSQLVTVYLTNLSFNLNEEDLFHIFKQSRLDIQRVKLIRNEKG